MGSLSSLGIGLSIVFGFLLLALVAELYYLLWWKKRSNKRELEYDSFFHLFCWKSPSSLSSAALNSVKMGDTHCTSIKPYGEDDIESELMRLHNLSGPARFLFTIKEETKEDLESEGVKGSKSRSLSDLFLKVDTPFLTPLSSPRDSYSNSSNPYGFKFNPMFEVSREAEMNGVKASPPPKFKFLKDAEEKLHRRILMEENEKRGLSSRVEGDESFVRIHIQPPLHSTSSQPTMVSEKQVSTYSPDRSTKFGCNQTNPGARGSPNCKVWGGLDVTK